MLINACSECVSCFTNIFDRTDTTADQIHYVFSAAIVLIGCCRVVRSLNRCEIDEACTSATLRPMARGARFYPILIFYAIKGAILYIS